MNEYFVTYELAVKLKEKGYPQCVYGKYHMLDACYVEEGEFFEKGCITEAERAYTAPTISQVMRWLREQKSIYLELVIVVDAEYMCDIYKIDPRPIECLGSTEYYKTYEQAALAGIEYVLDKMFTQTNI